jgi:hypothetical protein
VLTVVVVHLADLATTLLPLTEVLLALDRLPKPVTPPLAPLSSPTEHGPHKLPLVALPPAAKLVAKVLPEKLPAPAPNATPKPNPPTESAVPPLLAPNAIRLHVLTVLATLTNAAPTLDALVKLDMKVRIALLQLPNLLPPIPVELLLPLLEDLGSKSVLELAIFPADAS